MRIEDSSTSSIPRAGFALDVAVDIIGELCGFWRGFPSGTILVDKHVIGPEA